MDGDLKGFNGTRLEHGGSPQPIVSPNLALFYLSFSANSHTEWDRYAGTNGIIGHLWEAQQMVRRDCLSKCLWRKYSILMQILHEAGKTLKSSPVAPESLQPASRSSLPYGKKNQWIYTNRLYEIWTVKHITINQSIQVFQWENVTLWPSVELKWLENKADLKKS